jgi:hypothetical protein
MERIGVSPKETRLAEAAEVAFDLYSFYPFVAIVTKNISLQPRISDLRAADPFRRERGKRCVLSSRQRADQ